MKLFNIKQKNTPKSLLKARTYEQWLQAAKKLDSSDKIQKWKKEIKSPYYNYKLLLIHTLKIRELRNNSKFTELTELLYTSLHRNLFDLAESQLYETSYSGTKYIVGEYLEEVAKSMVFLTKSPIMGMSEKMKLNQIKVYIQNFGRTALFLSGGATLGIFHLGVVKALWENGLLPKVISGSSLGALIGGAICAHSDDELNNVFSNPTEFIKTPLLYLSFNDIINQKSLFDSTKLMDNIQHAVGNLTFKEAHERSGRVLNISVSAVRVSQKPRVLNYLTAPNVLISYAMLASCAFPGMFPPVVLKAKNKNGNIIPYIPDEKWIDGTVQVDIPQKRLSRLHNVNHFIVSQTNPHILPFMWLRKYKGVLPFSTDLMASLTLGFSVQILDVVRRHLAYSPINSRLTKIYKILDQRHIGDINICPDFDPFLFTKVLKNPSPKDINSFILSGERATWPKIEMIKDQTLIGRTLEECFSYLKKRI